MKEDKYIPKNLWIGNLFLADDCFEEPEFWIRDKSKGTTTDRYGHRTKELGRQYSRVPVKNQNPALARLTYEGRDAVDLVCEAVSKEFGGLPVTAKWSKNAGDKYGEKPGFQLLVDLQEA